MSKYCPDELIIGKEIKNVFIIGAKSRLNLEVLLGNKFHQNPDFQNLLRILV